MLIHGEKFYLIFIQYLNIFLRYQIYQNYYKTGLLHTQDTKDHSGYLKNFKILRVTQDSSELLKIF